MGIFSRWAVTIPDAGGRLDERDDNNAAKALREVSSGSASLEQFLRERQLIPVDDTYAIDQARKRVERSGLVGMMQETCAAINEMVGRSIVDAHSFLPPEAILCCFIFVEDGAEYLMRLELQGEIPTLVFAERIWRDTVTNDFVRWAHRLAEIEPITINVKLVHEFKDLRISAEQVQQWFMYVISGFDRSHIPTF
jgi:hypothetical protein